jgi:hypothetical protein
MLQVVHGGLNLTGGGGGLFSSLEGTGGGLSSLGRGGGGVAIGGGRPTALIGGGKAVEIGGGRPRSLSCFEVDFVNGGDKDGGGMGSLKLLSCLYLKNT